MGKVLICYRFYDPTNQDIFFVLAHDKGEARCIADYFHREASQLCGTTPYENALLCEGAIIYQKPLTMD